MCMRAKQDKYIDLNQFPHDNNGNISWKNSIGVVVEFFYNGIRHEMEIIEKVSRNYFKIRVDDFIIDKAHSDKIKNIAFENIFYKPQYVYNIGDVVRDIQILDQLFLEAKSNHGSGVVHYKWYSCLCLVDGYEFNIREYDLVNGVGCPVCSGRVVKEGVNDIATTNPELVKFFVNVDDAKKYSKCSNAEVRVRCPNCGFEKTMSLVNLSNSGHVSCDRCSDGISYPNKFAHQFFEQLSLQYDAYECEYSPDWAGLYRYDNYIRMNDGREIIVEMDGAFHKNQNVKDADKKKDELCRQHDIDIIRIKCDYIKTHERYEYIKNNMIDSLSDYFNLDEIDWDKCNDAGLSSCFLDVIDFYKQNPKLGLEDIASHFGISKGTIYSYLYIGEDLGICKYIRADSNRSKNSKPVAMYTIDGDIIGVFKSAKVIEESFPDKDFKHRNIRQSIQDNKTYKGYVFKFATFEEYQSFNDVIEL